MLRHLARFWKWIVNAEDAHAILTWIIPLIPAGIGGWLTTLSQGTPLYVAWLVALVSFAVFAAARFYVADYNTQFGLAGHITTDFVPPSLISANNSKYEYRIYFNIKNTSSRPIFFRPRSRVVISGLIAEDQQFESTRCLPLGNISSMGSEPVYLDKHESSPAWKGEIEIEYGFSPERLRMSFKMSAKSLDSSSYNITGVEYKPIS